jgi:hypothetical protein
VSEPVTKEKRTRGSMRAAINAFCKGCIYDQHQPGTWRQQVEACTSYRCALYQFRPISTVIEEAEEASEVEAA